MCESDPSKRQKNADELDALHFLVRRVCQKKQLQVRVQKINILLSESACESEVGAGEPWPPLDFENLSKKGHFLSFEWVKPNFTTFAVPLVKFWKSL